VSTVCVCHSKQLSASAANYCTMMLNSTVTFLHTASYAILLGNIVGHAFVHARCRQVQQYGNLLQTLVSAFYCTLACCMHQIEVVLLTSL
jgi:hypothetical protein